MCLSYNPVFQASTFRQALPLLSLEFCIIILWGLKCYFIWLQQTHVYVYITRWCIKKTNAWYYKNLPKSDMYCNAGKKILFESSVFSLIDVQTNCNFVMIRTEDTWNQSTNDSLSRCINLIAFKICFQY